MKATTIRAGAFLLAVYSSTILVAREPIRLASTPALSPDGATLAFSWHGDIWTVSSSGGAARRLTMHSGIDAEPEFSPDGTRLAFTSKRSGSWQVYVMSASGGSPRQRTFHSEGHSLQEWSPDGKAFLTLASRDHFWRSPRRFFRINADKRVAGECLFDAYGQEGKLSPDGGRLLFTREGTRWWRKGYRGSQASQVWMYESKTKKFSKLAEHETGCRAPLWQPDGRGFYYLCAKSGAFNLWERKLGSKKEKQLTHFKDDSIVAPCISRDGSAVVFRQLFDLYRLRPGKDSKPKRLKIYHDGDPLHEPTLRRRIAFANDVAFSKDGLEIAFIAGGDVWVMDTVLREPKQVTKTAEEERGPVFSPEGDAILFVSDQEGQSDLWKATRADSDAYWWQNQKFKLERLTQDAEVEGDIRFSPAGDQVAFLRGRGDLWVMKPSGKDARRVIASWNDLDYDWSPDGKWFVYAQSDNDFNRDIWLAPLDGSRKPFNLSRHPDNDTRPVWSPDGKMIAFTGRRMDSEVDIYYVHLRKREDETGSRDRKLKQALEKIQKIRKKKTPAKQSPVKKSPVKKGTKTVAKKKAPEKKAPEKKNNPAKKVPEVIIDFEEIHRRIRRVSIPDSSESNLFWSHDSKKLAFNATVSGKRGTYTISPPESLSPKLLSTTTGSGARWISQGNQILWLTGGKPAALSSTGSATSYSFSARQQVDVSKRYEAAFDLCWRAMRDNFYDGNLNNRNWDAIRRKYAPMAAASIDKDMFSRVVSLMLGELNGSHLGFRAFGSTTRTTASSWQESTAHLGLRFDASHKGPGLKVQDVIPRGPADKQRSKIAVGEILLSIDGVTVDPAMDLTAVLNGPLDRDIRLRVKSAKGEERDVVLRPISFSVARALLYEAWMESNRRGVEKASGGKLAYLHIRAMNMSSFYRFERELYAVAAGKDGLVIDVRENGGGSTTDHLLTVLTQPSHAITEPRGGGPGYPQDRRVYATWNKPIVVLCNQNSFSNAEIFSHAVKTLKRGQLVGVPTSGSVISTGGRRIMDLGFLRMPFRGWFVLGSGEDMELHGAVPHHVVWPQPGEIPSGKDRQLDKAIQVLKADVQTWRKRPRPKLRKASERKR